MTTLLLHVVGAFTCLVILNRLFNSDIPLEHLMLLSLAATLPDIIDKTLTGTRYPFHSLLVSGMFLLLLNLIVRFYMNSHPDFSSKYPMISRYLLLGSIAFLTHPILDLEGIVPLFYPIDLRGYQLNFQIIIIQTIPPRISDLSCGFLIYPFNYDLTYDHEGTLLNTLDILLIFLLGLTIVFKFLHRIKKHMILTE
ncbi:MAG: metal-dependent hydrolase [Promethearchaeota archaeon]